MNDLERVFKGGQVALRADVLQEGLIRPTPKISKSGLQHVLQLARIEIEQAYGVRAKPVIVIVDHTEIHIITGLTEVLIPEARFPFVSALTDVGDHLCRFQSRDQSKVQAAGKHRIHKATRISYEEKSRSSQAL